MKAHVGFPRQRLSSVWHVSCSDRLLISGAIMEIPLRLPDALKRLTAVFSEMPGTRLSFMEAALLTGLDGWACHLALKALEDAGFLRRTTDGRYVRQTSDSPYS